MSTNKSAVDHILDQGEHFDPTTVPGFEEREANGEFEGKTPSEIREILLNEAEMEDYNREEAEGMAEEDARNEEGDD